MFGERINWAKEGTEFQGKLPAELTIEQLAIQVRGLIESGVIPSVYDIEFRGPGAASAHKTFLDKYAENYIKPADVDLRDYDHKIEDGKDIVKKMNIDEFVDRKIKEGVKNNSLSKEQLAQLTKEKEILEDYLDNRKALRKVNGEYVPVQYLHSGGRTAATARAELAVLKSALPDVYEKLSKSYDAYTDAFRFLLDEQYKNGMISKSVYDELFSYNYIPTKYIQYFIENELSQDNPVLASKLSSSIKNLTGGSDSDVITNFQAILELYTNSVYKRI
jgi:hypothetical protein